MKLKNILTALALSAAVLAAGCTASPKESAGEMKTASPATSQDAEPYGASDGDSPARDLEKETGEAPDGDATAGSLEEETGEAPDGDAPAGSLEEETGEAPDGDAPAESQEKEKGEAPDKDSPAESSPEEDERIRAFREGKVFISDLPEEDLVKPEEEIDSAEDMVYALDYLAFYRIGDKVWFRIAPEFAEEIYNPYTVYRQAYSEADLADVYACQMDDSCYRDYGFIGLKYSMSRDIASVPPAQAAGTPVLPSFDYEALEGENEIIFATDDLERQPVSCENGEQLYYLAMNGCRPVPAEGSAAYGLYEEAKNVLRSLVTEDMTDFLKIKAVYDWLTTEVCYDAATAYSSETYLVREQAYYLEGVFLNRCAVCDGKAKAAALLLNMLGIPCVRTSGVNEDGDHAWNMVCLEGKWYVFCATYGQADLAETLGYVVPNYSMLLSGAEPPYEWYPADKHKDIEEMLEMGPVDIFGEMGEAAGVSLKISDMDGLKDLLDQASACGKKEFKAEFEYTGEDSEAFAQALADHIAGIRGVNAAQVRTVNPETVGFQIYFTAG